MAATTTTATQPIQLSFPLPHAAQTRIQIHLTQHKTALLLFITSTTPDTDSGAAPMGSFVYAIPNRATPTAQPLSTALYTQTPTLDVATRLAKILAKRTAMPTYVGNSVSFASAGAGGSVEEEMEGVRRVVEVVMGVVGKNNGNMP
ncbi:uncharacterized protein K452DRAFT_225325 [Aplosporella prunicola CBS 121167]|uniref:Proteasome assembly chaperone 3 n=1 Tax=Aplosporella prunicola CBS 121167 TaxID=1176127 RepID=A0A6A6BGS0_9PEZI|nr:uncharacterized protein K452DRAFT_225325 [Aplosporella prunicola CBS 121167]KAF2143339.1 hypothetical protein K452DRAFT_225325 [Aplosporella prunicola CBS 121167]